MKRFLLMFFLFLISCSEKQRSASETNLDHQTAEEKPEYKISGDASGTSDSDSTVNECIYSDLSNNYIFRTKFKRIAIADQDSCIVQLDIIKRTTNEKIDSIVGKLGYLYSNAFQNCQNARSYITGTNATQEAQDNNYGDLVIADFNFDSKEDVALINDSGGNGGPLYSFYLQTNNDRFKRNNFLSDTMKIFPSKMLSNTKTLITYVHAGACDVSENVFQWNEEKKDFTGISRTLINICEK